MKTVRVEAELGGGSQIRSSIRGHTLVVDQPTDGGGKDAGPTPLEYYFLSVAGCMGSIARIVARQKRIDLRSIRFTVEGDLDVSVLLGKNKDDRAGFVGLKIIADVDADLSREQKIEFLEEVEARCPVSDNTAKETPVTLEVL